MTITPLELVFYAGAILILFLTPGPVWVALTARAMSGGFTSAAPLAVGVALGDMLWPLAAIFGLTWILSIYGDLLEAMKWVAVAMFVVMGWQLIRHAARDISADSRLTRPGALAGFAAGVTVILANPKAILFYMGVLPGFFDLTRVTWADITAIILVSVSIPMLGNLMLALLIDRARALLRSGTAIARTNRIAGGLMIGVGMVIAVT
ncbi:LysE family translocator [Roseinatronobacter bogoriensis]|uniref:LysE family translocator n=1 Tax=Roseinatronobacter bogoriensis subsp. barguzinensis TaxID=441209 RepID=A0A2K8K4M2_9RHOB|nr:MULTISPECIES: LysE family translocator [Rhodobaca]ATX64414.1 LysE family translocator [Rhodobaca barguzinensis]MBB4209117.1 threonine/homoserine/homoserine lactone efflux protein [Rhodobaca bogoriensis DSM 18756]TDW36355.1 threonine/homoserine/homoserine lactone efflux protein [Rhodobaca barguzinensis]TDY67517.1 threonine/homoserine/homoserine lactone efflux protein [Rhodobaca bogoriensis DSM 18756]